MRQAFPQGAAGMTAVMVEEISRRLAAALHPVELEVLDEGYKHAGHANDGKGHFHVRIVSPDFAGALPISGTDWFTLHWGI
jgi:BolA protein